MEKGEKERRLISKTREGEGKEIKKPLSKGLSKFSESTESDVVEPKVER